MRRLFSFRTTTAILLALILSAVAYGFAAANTVPDSKAGDGSGAVSGYTISAIHYILDATTPSEIDTVTFTTDVAVPATGTVYVVADNGTGTEYKSNTCSGLGTTSLSCDFTTNTLTVLNLKNLRVVAVQ